MRHPPLDPKKTGRTSRSDPTEERDARIAGWVADIIIALFVALVVLIILSAVSVQR
jgi:hypothetical protein